MSSCTRCDRKKTQLGHASRLEAIDFVLLEKRKRTGLLVHLLSSFGIFKIDYKTTTNALLWHLLFKFRLQFFFPNFHQNWLQDHDQLHLVTRTFQISLAVVFFFKTVKCFYEIFAGCFWTEKYFTFLQRLGRNFKTPFKCLNEQKSRFLCLVRLCVKLYTNDALTVTRPDGFVFFSEMGCFGSKEKLSKEDLDFLLSHTRYDESTIKEWYKGFKVSFVLS